MSLLLALYVGSSAAQTKAGQVLSTPPATEEETDGFFSAYVIDDGTFARMRRGGSFPADCTVERESLRYLRVLHYNYSGQVQTGELVCNKSIAADLLAIFRELFREKYPIYKIVLIDEYGASDEASMADNNTSCFCFRRIKGSSALSKHSLGLAVDINPADNPCVRYDARGNILTIEPDTPEARQTALHPSANKHAIAAGDVCRRLFARYGFSWGGNWRSKKDRQHFQK
ncbi:MAG: M15 family metallopeptidase [Prevotella sp.]|nr:M15 family metallopeptidase [Prevotella sp.]